MDIDQIGGITNSTVFCYTYSSFKKGMWDKNNKYFQIFNNVRYSSLP